MKEQVTKFDLNAAFKALDEISYPVVKGGIKANRIDLHETFTRKQNSEVLIEDYYDIGDQSELEQAQEDRTAEVAKAKLARIEKIVDLEADSEEDILPSYVGKFIIQCPQCMQMFYKDEADITKSEEDPNTVNVGEQCPNCSNDQGFDLIGKVGAVEEDEMSNYTTDELNLDFEEPVEETEEEDVVEEEPVEEETSDEDLDLTNISVEEEKTEESFVKPTGESLVEQVEDALKEEKEICPECGKEECKEALTEGTDLITTKPIYCAGGLDCDPRDYDIEVVSVDHTRSNEPVYIFRGTAADLRNFKDECFIDIADDSNGYTDADFGLEESLKESADEDLNKKLEAHNKYIVHVQNKIKAAEKELANEKNEEIKASIQKTIDAYKEELESALPEAVKGDLQTEDLPDADEVDLEDIEVKESLTESLDDEETKKFVELTKKCGLKTMAEVGKFKRQHHITNDQDLLVELEKCCNGKCEEAICPVCGDEVDEPCEDCKKELTEAAFSVNKLLDQVPELKVLTGRTVKKLIKLYCDDMGFDSYNDIDIEDFKEWLLADINDFVYDFGKELDLEELADLIAGLAPEIVSFIKHEDDEFAKERNEPSFFDTEHIRRSVKGYLDEFIPSVDRADKQHLTPEEKAAYQHKGLEEVIDYLRDCDKAGLIKIYPEVVKEKPAGEESIEEAQCKLYKEISHPEEDMKELKETFVEACLREESELLPDEISDEDIDKLFDSKEFQTPVSEKDVEKAIAATSENVVEEVDIEDVEDLDECSMNKAITEYLQTVYENVDKFEATGCELKNKKLVVEGVITFNSGTTRTTLFEFKKRNTKGNAIIFRGLNESFSKDPVFLLRAIVEDKKLITEKLKYKYEISGNLVEGIVRLQEDREARQKARADRKEAKLDNKVLKLDPNKQALQILQMSPDLVDFNNVKVVGYKDANATAAANVSIGGQTKSEFHMSLEKAKNLAKVLSQQKNIAIVEITTGKSFKDAEGTSTGDGLILQYENGNVTKDGMPALAKEAQTYVMTGLKAANKAAAEEKANADAVAADQVEQERQANRLKSQEVQQTEEPKVNSPETKTEEPKVQEAPKTEEPKVPEVKTEEPEVKQEEPQLDANKLMKLPGMTTELINKLKEIPGMTTETIYKLKEIGALK